MAKTHLGVKIAFTILICVVGWVIAILLIVAIKEMIDGRPFKFL
jgi:hypothetical protein